MTIIEISEAQSQFQQVIAAALRGEEVILTQDQQPVVKITGILTDLAPRRPGSAEGMIWMSDDFNDSFEDFTDDIP